MPLNDNAPAVTPAAAAPAPVGVASLHGMVSIAIGVAALVAAAKVSVPFWPVPVTLQSLAVPLIALLLGGRRGTTAVGAYLLLGLAGLPVFAGTPPQAAGPLYFAGPTGGYLLAMPIAVWLAAVVYRQETGPSWLKGIIAALSSNAVILGVGTLWLAVVLHLGSGTTINWSHASAVGFLPFILGDIVKALLAASIAEAVGSKLRRRV